jgi:hypothetical protein
MTSVATGIGVCCAVGLNMAAVVVRQTPPPPTVKPPLQTSAKATEAEITVTGCLVQGSAPNVFVLQNAKRDPQSAAEKAARYIVAPATEDLVLKPHLNHQVRILGVPDGRPQPTPPASGSVDEKLVPALNAKSLTMVSASCGGGGGGDWSEADASAEDGPRHVGPRKDRGGSIGLGSGGAGSFGAGFSLASSTNGRASGRFVNGGPFSLYGGIGFARTSSVTGAFSPGGPSDINPESESESEFEEVLSWTTPVPSHPFDGPAEQVPGSTPGTMPTSQAIEALMDHVARTTATELLGEDVPAGGLTMAPAALEAPIVNPEPGTLLLIASGLLLVVYAGRGREWNSFRRRRSAR